MVTINLFYNDTWNLILYLKLVLDFCIIHSQYAAIKIYISGIEPLNDRYFYTFGSSQGER
jgi:hypothetical protein